jgi:hypothetical protein
MKAIPYFGIYSPNYTFFIPIHVLHSQSISETLFNTFPYQLKTHLMEFNEKYKVPLDYFLITFDGTFLWSKYHQFFKDQDLRVNTVLHPYIFNDLRELNRDHTTIAYSCIYTNDTLHGSYLKETEEMEAMKINPEKLLNDYNKKEIILHRSEDNYPAISPNNCSFIFNINNTFSTFFLICIVTYKNTIVKMCICQCNFFMNNEIQILSPIVRCLTSGNFLYNDPVLVKKFLITLLVNYEIFNHITQTNFSYICSYLVKEHIAQSQPDELLKIIKRIFDFTFLKKVNLIDGVDEGFTIIDEYEGSSLSYISKYYLNNLCFFIWFSLGGARIKNIGELILFSSGDFLPDILFKYLRKVRLNLEIIINSYVTFFRSYKSNMFKLDEQGLKKEVEIEASKLLGIQLLNKF